MKGLEKSKNAKECGDLTVLPLGYLSSIHKDQTLALLQALHDELEEKEQVLKAHSEAHHEQFLKDELAHKHGQTLKTLEVMKMHEGSTSAYRGGILDGKMEAIQDQKDNLQALMDKINV